MKEGEGWLDVVTQKKNKAKSKKWLRRLKAVSFPFFSNE
jgi:hypothetical protein